MNDRSIEELITTLDQLDSLRYWWWLELDGLLQIFNAL